MEQDIMSSHSDSSHPLDGDGGVGAEEDEFGDFSLPMVCSPLGLVDATELPSYPIQTCPTLKPATHQPNSTSVVKLVSDMHCMDEEWPNCNCESSLHCSNLHAEGDLKSGAFSASLVSSPVEETGFADFTLFTEQAGHPWCCGFTEQWDQKPEGANNSSGEHTCHLRLNVITELKPKVQHTCKKDACIIIKQCDKRTAVLAQPPQGHHQLQEAAATLSFASVDEQHAPGNTQERSHNSRQTSEMEPQVSSLASQGDQVIDDEADKPKICRHSFSIIRSEINLNLSEPQLSHSNHYTTQETSVTSRQSHFDSNTQNKFAHLTDDHLEPHRDREPVQTADTGIQSLGNLPPSDSFADFCSAPMQEDVEGLWVDFKHHFVEGKTWTQVREPVSPFYTGRDYEEEQESSGEKGETKRNSCQASLDSRVQLLLQSSFPEILVPAVEREEGLLNLGALLQTQHLPESEEELPELSHALRIQQLMLRPHQDVYRSLGLQFQWGGSHANTSLLRCLGVDERNIVFVGTKKQPVTVSTYVSGLRMLVPTKDPLPDVYSPQQKGSWCTLDPSTHSMQLNWSSRSLSSSQEGTSPCRAPHM